MPVHMLGPAAPATIALPFFSFCVPAGFPSPAQDHMEGSISLDELMNIRAPHTYLPSTSTSGTPVRSANDSSIEYTSTAGTRLSMTVMTRSLMSPYSA